MDQFVSPASGWRGWAADRLANAGRLRALRRATIGRLPFLRLRSDVRDILYANWVVPVDRVRAFVPDGVEPWERGGLTILTALTYRHGHFGPAFLGPLRRIFPSPHQSNWRVYVAAVNGEAPVAPTVLFMRNVFDSAAYALGARLMSDALPAHHARIAHDWDGSMVRSAIDGGTGSAPAATIMAERSGKTLPDAFARWFADADQAIAALCLQDGALAPLPDRERVAAARIALPIDPAAAIALRTTLYRPGALLDALGAAHDPWCFIVPRAAFEVLGERLLPAPIAR